MGVCPSEAIIYITLMAQQHTGLDDGTATCAVERAAGPSFMVRSMHYMRTKVKEPSGMEVYR